MNNTCDLKLIQACHEEIEHRVSVYEKYKNPNLEDGAAKNFQDYAIPWIDPSTQESIYADPTSFKTVTMKRKSKNTGKKNFVQATEDGNNENNKESKMSAIDDEIIEILKQTTKEDIYGALPFHEKNITKTLEEDSSIDLDDHIASLGSLPVSCLSTSGQTGSSHPGWTNFPIESKTTRVSDSDFQHQNFVEESSCDIQNCVKEVENHSVQSITKNVLSPDEIFANDPFFNSEPDFGVELKSQVGTYNLAGKQILFHNIM